MIRKFIALSVAALLVVTAFFSFRQSKSITELVIVEGLGIDMEESGCTVTLQYLDLSKSSGSSEGYSGALTKVASANGKTPDSAVSSLRKSISGELFFGQVKLVVLNTFALENCKDELSSFLLKQTSLRSDALIVEGKRSAQAVLSNQLRGERVPSEALCRQLVLVFHESPRVVRTVNDFIINPYEKLPTVQSKGDYCTVHRN